MFSLSKRKGIKASKIAMVAITKGLLKNVLFTILLFKK
ncbi:MAG: hypothetical protein ACI9FW_001311 [Flavobacterium sp.]|jgi:hypothetical protein